VLRDGSTQQRVVNMPRLELLAAFSLLLELTGAEAGMWELARWLPARKRTASFRESPLHPL
jgi:hypothetical protein